MRKSGLVKKAMVLGLTVAMALGTMVTGNAEGKVWKYSFNTGGVKEVPLYAENSGWIPAYTDYTKEAGYGLEAGYADDCGVYTKQPAVEANTRVATAGADVGLDLDPASEMYAAIGVAVYKDKNGSDLNWYVDLPAGTYKFTIYAGGISSNNTYDPNKIYLQGEVFDKAITNGGPKDGYGLYTLEDLAFERTITLTEATKVEVKASNPNLTGDAAAVYGKDTAGGRAYLNAIVIEEVTADTDVPKTGVVSTVLVCGVVALASAGVAVITRKKED